MKKIIAIAAIAMMMASCMDVNAQAGGIAKGENYANWSYPDSMSGSKTVLFPTYTSVAPTWASDSVNVKVGEFFTYVALDSMTQQSRVKLSTQSYVTGGARLFIKAYDSPDTSLNLIVVQGTTYDTLPVINHSSATWFYTGSSWVRCGKW